MAAPALVNSVATAHSTTAGPTSVTPTLTSTTAGNFLVLAVFVTGTTPTITTPTNWTQVYKNTANNTVLGLYIYPNNPGSITSVAVTVGGTGGGAVAAAAEFSGVSASQLVVESSTTQVSASSNAPNLQYAIYPPQVNELEFMAFGFAAATVSSSTVSVDMANSVGNDVSTTGTPNAQLACRWGLSLAMILGSVTLNLGSSVATQGVGIRMLSNFGQFIDYVQTGGGVSITVPPNNQGSIGIG